MTIQLSHTQKKTPWSACPVWASLVSHWIALRILYSVGLRIESIPASSSRTIWCPSSEGKPCCSNNGLGKMFMNCWNKAVWYWTLWDTVGILWQQVPDLTAASFASRLQCSHAIRMRCRSSWSLLALGNQPCGVFSQLQVAPFHHRIINKLIQSHSKIMKFLWKACLKLGWGGQGQCNWYTEIWFV